MASVLMSPELAGGGAGDLILISAGDLLLNRNLVFNTLPVGSKSQLWSADHDKALSVDWFNDKLLLILLKK